LSQAQGRRLSRLRLLWKAGTTVKSFREVRVESPAGLEDELVGRVFALGSRGSWTEHLEDERIRLHVFFAGDDADAPIALRRALAELAGVRVSAAAAVEDADWAASWRAAARPIAVGERFLIDPREPADVREPVDAGGRYLLRLPARTAFGVGSHESTRLAVELLETLPVEGTRVLDVGTGTGILAFAALLLGARAVVACDLDPAAALLLPEHMRLNGLRIAAWAGSLQALSAQDQDQEHDQDKTKASIEGKDSRQVVRGGTGLPRRPGRGFDLVLANVIPEEIEADLPALAAALRPGAMALFSGILSSALESAISRVDRHGLRHPPRPGRQAGGRAVVTAGEWAAFVAERVR
jgi:ribosomal protein L11 methylase PrmA